MEKMKQEIEKKLKERYKNQLSNLNEHELNAIAKFAVEDLLAELDAKLDKATDSKKVGGYLKKYYSQRTAELINNALPATITPSEEK